MCGVLEGRARGVHFHRAALVEVRDFARGECAIVDADVVDGAVERTVMSVSVTNYKVAGTRRGRGHSCGTGESTIDVQSSYRSA